MINATSFVLQGPIFEWRKYQLTHFTNF